MASADGGRPTARRLLERLRERLSPLVARASALPAVVTLRKVMDTYNGATGGLLAAGLAYGALITLLLSVLLFVGVLGFVIGDAAVREDLIARLSERIPPLEALVRDGLTRVAETAGASSVLGIAGLVWSVSRFYGSLDEAFARIFRLAPVRGTVDRLVRGFILVGMLIGGFFGVLIVTGIQQGVDAALPPDPAGDALRLVLRVGVPLAEVAFITLIVAAVYRWVPNVSVAARDLGPPALVVAAAMAVLTQMFVFLAPRLVGSLSVFGGVAAVFAALAWLSFGFQALLIGAAWTRERVRERDPVALPPTSREEAVAARRREPRPPPPPGVQPAPPRDSGDPAE